GASESLLARQQQQQRPQSADKITTVSDGRRDAADEDPLLRRIRSLTIALSLLSSQPAAGSKTDTSFTHILVRKPSGSSSDASGLYPRHSPNLMFELFAMYREWQEEMAMEISGSGIVNLSLYAPKLVQDFIHFAASWVDTNLISFCKAHCNSQTK
ncbi:hypothetical protein ZWY2020_041846, partial [Hordeum vulgare]